MEDAVPAAVVGDVVAACVDGVVAAGVRGVVATGVECVVIGRRHTEVGRARSNLNLAKHTEAKVVCQEV